MHIEVMQYLEEVRRDFPSFFSGARVLDVGSLDVNGSNRWAFHDCLHTGIDLIPGPNVDEVESAIQHAKTHQGFYDVVLCTEVLEHDENAHETMHALLSMLRSYGLLIITCAGPDRPEHGTHRCNPTDSPATLDHYQNLSQLDFMEAYGNGEMLTFKFQYARGEMDCQFHGIKR